ncbi:PTS fructose-like transporter subunit IIB [Arsenicicoccus dermatophilus]|uniref:PTS fructose-like transporter subunit IIB n=1 Tax=Arsenicicoccus dermatophilus TaxID=1076331 RepID=UPI003916FBB0
MKFVGVTSCPTGIAHTYMAAEALEQAAKAAGHEMVVETQGSAGSDPLDPAVIAAADGVIFAHDLEVKDAGRFAGKPTVDVGVKRAVSGAPELIEQAVAAVEQARASTPVSSAPAAGSAGGPLNLVGVTSCPTGIAHTYMAAEALEQAAKAAGHEMVVETQGSAGSDPLDPAVIAAADGVIFAHDLEVKDAGRFAGKPTVDVGVKRAVSGAPDLIAEIERLVGEHRAQAGAGAPMIRTTPPVGATAAGAREADRVGAGTKVRQWLMTGVSYMIPFVAAGGILIALGFMLATVAAGRSGVVDVTAFTLDVGDPKTPVLQNVFEPGSLMHWAALLFWIGKAAFAFLVPVLSGYIAYGIADRPGLVPGFAGGAIAMSMGAGFLGGIVTGFLAGFVARGIAGWKVPKGLRGIMPVMVIPLLSTLITGAAMVLLLGRPIKALMDALTSALNGMTGSNAVLLGLILGLMMGFDLGGPVNKVAYTFGTTGLATAGAAMDAPQLKIMAAVMGAGMVAPWGLALATALRPRLFTEAEQENGKACWLLGASFISEGAIPFAAADPGRIIPASMVGSGLAGAMIMAFGCTSRAPHGGLWVTPLIGSWPMFLLAVGAGAVVTAGLVIVLKGTARTATVETPATAGAVAV